MRWHLELIIESALVGVILCQTLNLRWFETLIGVDFLAGLVQIIPYREGYRGFSRLFWEAGIILALPLIFMAVVEAGNMQPSRVKFWHLRILAAWISVQLCCISLQTQPALVLAVNGWLLTADALAFVAWAFLFLTE